MLILAGITATINKTCILQHKKPIVDLFFYNRFFSHLILFIFCFSRTSAIFTLILHLLLHFFIPLLIKIILKFVFVLKQQWTVLIIKLLSLLQSPCLLFARQNYFCNFVILLQSFFIEQKKYSIFTIQQEEPFQSRHFLYSTLLSVHLVLHLFGMLHYNLVHLICFCLVLLFFGKLTHLTPHSLSFSCYSLLFIFKIPYFYIIVKKNSEFSTFFVWRISSFFDIISLLLLKPPFFQH